MPMHECTIKLAPEYGRYQLAPRIKIKALQMLALSSLMSNLKYQGQTMFPQDTHSLLPLQGAHRSVNREMIIIELRGIVT